MNNLHFSEGGQPISLDDLKQLNDNINEGLALLAKLCGDGILDGCQSGGQINGNGTLAGITEGHVVIGGVIYEVDRTELYFEGIGLPDLPEVYLVPTTEESRTMEFADGSTHPTRSKKKAVVVRERPVNGEYLAYKMVVSNKPVPFIPRNGSGRVEVYPIIRGEEEIGYLKLHYIQGLEHLRACELHVGSDNKVIREIDSSTHEMYRLKGQYSSSRSITLTNVVDQIQLDRYDIIIVNGSISLRKGGAPVTEFDGKGLNAFGITNPYYSTL